MCTLFHCFGTPHVISERTIPKSAESSTHKKRIPNHPRQVETESAKVTISGTDVLLVCSRTTEYNGRHVAVNSAIYVMEHNRPVEINVLYSSSEGGLRLADGKLYTISPDEATSYEIVEGEFVYDEMAWRGEAYDETSGTFIEGEYQYFYDTRENPRDDCTSDEETFNQMQEKCKKAESIDFTVVSK